MKKYILLSLIGCVLSITVNAQASNTYTQQEINATNIVIAKVMEGLDGAYLTEDVRITEGMGYCAFISLDRSYSFKTVSYVVRTSIIEKYPDVSVFMPWTCDEGVMFTIALNVKGLSGMIPIVFYKQPEGNNNLVIAYVKNHKL